MRRNYFIVQEPNGRKTFTKFKSYTQMAKAPNWLNRYHPKSIIRRVTFFRYWYEKLTYKKPKQIQVVNNMYNKVGKPELLLYHDEVCPTCGRYSYNGDVCSLCKKDYDLEDKKETYGL